MPKTTQTPAAAATAAFQRNLAALMRAAEVADDTELWKMVKKRATKSQKTVNNAAKGRHDSKISTYNAIAEAIGAPMWVLFIPELNADELDHQVVDRLVKVVQHYIRCDAEGKTHVESMAAAFAAKARKV